MVHIGDKGVEFTSTGFLVQNVSSLMNILESKKDVLSFRGYTQFPDNQFV